MSQHALRRGRRTRPLITHAGRAKRPETGPEKGSLNPLTLIYVDVNIMVNQTCVAIA